MSSLCTRGFARLVTWKQVSCHQVDGGSGQDTSEDIHVQRHRTSSSAEFFCQEYNSVKAIECQC